MLKKSFLRVKQRADQGLGRAEKTEVLSEDLQNAEKKVEALKQVLQNLVKKLTASLQAHNIQDAEKRAKKMPIVHLASSLSDNSSQLGEGMLSDVMQQCSMGLHSIGYAQQFYELTVENSFLSYFQEILDVDVPAIKKSKQQLNKLTLDMDATRSRQQSAAQNSSHSSQTKTESLNNELEDAEHKVASCKDQYATEMFTFLSKESEICNKIIEWMTAQMSLYKTSVTHLEDMLADLKCMTEQHATKPVYGNPLEEHLQSTGREIALVIEACIGILYHDGLEEEGLFRIAAGASKLKKLKAAFNVGALVDMEEYYTDYHVVAGALKQYIRELPEPLLTYDLYEEFIQCMNAKDREAKLTQMWTTIYKLPKPNLANVKYLIKFLAKLAEKSDINKMTPSNISIVFGPNLLSPRNKDPGSDVVLSGIQNHVVETLILHHDYFFPGEFELHESGLPNSFTKITTNNNELAKNTDSKSCLNSSLSHSISNSPSICTNASSTSDSISSSGHSHNTCSTDTLSHTPDSLTLRKKHKGSRLSFPSALNSAGDKIFGKRRTESVKNKSVFASEADKKDKKTLKEFLGIRRSTSKDKLKELSRSLESGLNNTEAVEPQSPSRDVLTQEHNSPIGEVVFKPRYTPPSEKQLDCWLTGTPDAPLAHLECDESPLVVEPPTRSFPLSNTSLPYRLHGDMYDTAFALTSLKADGSAVTGLQYLNKVHSVVNSAYVNSSNRSGADSLTEEEIQFADVDSIGGSSNSSSPPTIAPSMHSFGQSTSGAGDCRDGNANDKKPHYEHSASQSSLSNSQISLSSNESGGTNLTHSPSLNRKFKKHAPPPPPTNPPQLHKEASKPDGPDYKHSEHSVIKKPSIPPPGPPVKPLARPTNAPPPKPTVPPHPNVLNSPKTPSNPFEDNSDVKFEPVNASSFGIPSRSLSDSATPTADTKAKTHARNVSAADIKVDQSPSPEVKGHNRTKSHDFKLRQPPPIPQRTHSIPAKHSPEHKRLAAAASVPAPPNKIEPSVASPDKLVDVGPTNQTGNAYLEVSSDVIIESTENTVETADKIEYRDRMNSQSDATSL